MRKVWLIAVPRLMIVRWRYVAHLVWSNLSQRLNFHMSRCFMTCAPSEDSDHPRLIIVFTGRIKKAKAKVNPAVYGGYSEPAGLVSMMFWVFAWCTDHVLVFWWTVSYNKRFELLMTIFLEFTSGFRNILVVMPKSLWIISLKIGKLVRGYEKIITRITFEDMPKNIMFWILF